MNTNDIMWKYKQHKSFIKNGLKHSVLKDLVSKGNRTKTFELWSELPRMVASSMGCEFTKDTPSVALNEIFVEEIYDIDGFVPAKNEIVYDVGASYGDSAIWWSKLKGAEVFAFEPLVDIFSILEANINLNNVNVKPFNLAIGDGEIHNSSREGEMMSKSYSNNNSVIKTTRLDDLHIDRMDILKIDVEGFELDVLNGATRCLEKIKPRIIIETHSTELKNQCDKLLRELGYTLEKNGRKVKPKSGWMDLIQNLFYSI